MSQKLNTPVETPSGLVFPNRLVKAAMAEAMAVNSDPGDRYISAYTSWGSGGWGGLLTGNVEVSTIYKGSNDAITFKPDASQATKDAWKRWALAAQREGTPTIVQLVHPGRQSPAKSGNRGFFEPSIAPSPIPLNIGDGLLERALAKFAFGTPREMTEADIQEVVQQFAVAAKFAYESGFKGVELHGAHGYLLSAFLSPKSNVRTDGYGGTAAKRARIVIEVIRAVRKLVPASFTVGIKFNSADVSGAENLEESLEQVGLIAKEQIDFLEISGGSYENPRMAAGDDPKAARTAKREAFFLDYAHAVRERYPNLLLMVTGGFRSRKGMEDALQSGAVDLIGVGRPAVVYPHLPKDVLLNLEVKDEEATVDLPLAKAPWLLRMVPIKLVSIGADTVFYVKQIMALGDGKKPEAPPKH
ncbi:FMN-linked oxidoreductase [Aaosphaeria arxii CBS 175.79]|uniref:FMN-linked oxidoreductase n=1 Tax=Aaosphaeria arxii CBS 175.79 TaxID=1450172 RepID=A0A6A5XKT8_9PLEO|nr:FMN-linked oxidoreductase [Aaosphaeria arxii CBS 175.79]KAF2013506.1 FMN-linked oxidoreductase [Aaosphaeria arxii CBS 175.79]